MSDAPSRLSPVRQVSVLRVSGSHASTAMDLAAAEEPLEVRLHGRPFAVIMRTPGNDRELAAGFLFSEGVLDAPSDLGAVEHCRHPKHPDVHNVVDVYLIGAAAGRLDRMLAERRNVVTNASCGTCGRLTIDALTSRAAPLGVATTITRDRTLSLPGLLRARQSLFDQTGGLHAAGLLSVDGTWQAAAEDVGRHNAVDKVVGRMLLDERLPLTGAVLVVSGRTSFEIVQKAWLAGVEIICAVSAPSSLAVDLASAAGITLIGFARERGFNVYTHVRRVCDV